MDSIFSIESLILIFLVICLVTYIWLDYDCLMNPVCPMCGHNLGSVRKSLFDSKAVCTVHGEFELK